MIKYKVYVTRYDSHGLPCGKVIKAVFGDMIEALKFTDGDNFKPVTIGGHTFYPMVTIEAVRR